MTVCAFTGVPNDRHLAPPTPANNIGIATPQCFGGTRGIFLVFLVFFCLSWCFFLLVHLVPKGAVLKTIHKWSCGPCHGLLLSQYHRTAAAGRLQAC